MPAAKVDSKIRQVAILLSSVDTNSARQLLGQLPTDQARQVRNAMVNLGKVTPEERRQALALFQQMNLPTGEGKQGQVRSSRPSNPAEAALASQSAQDTLDLSSNAGRQTPPPREIDFDRTEDVYHAPPTREDGEPNEIHHHWHQLDCHDLSELLACERPIVVAVVLNQVPVPLAASLTELLPKPLALDALSIIPKLQSTPQDVLQEIHHHLHQKISDFQLPKKSSEQNLKKLQAILAAAPSTFREACVERIKTNEPGIAKRLGWNDPPKSQFDENAMVSASASRIDLRDESTRTNPTPMAPAASNRDDRDEPDVIPFSRYATHSPSPVEPLKNTIRMSFEELESLPLADLATVLRASEPTVILLALSGASDRFMRQVQAMLPAKDAKRLETKIAQMGPIQLRDIDKAQSLLCETATRMLTQGKIGSLVSMTITAAA